MNTVLIPFDFSEQSISALQYTKKLFLGLDVTVYLLDVYNSNPSQLISKAESDSWLDEMDNTIEDELQYLTNVLNKEQKDITYKPIVKANNLLKAIQLVIDEYDIDIVITGTKRADSVTEAFIGSKTTKLINTISNTPIILVPISYKYKDFNKIVFSTNYKRPFSKHEIKPLLQISILNDCAIEVVNLSQEKSLTDKQLKHKTQLRKIFSDVDATVSYLKLDWNDSETKTIKTHLQESKSEMLVLINHKYNFFSRLLDENIIKKSAFQSNVPILVLPEIE